jgi:hypothetical protein
MWLRVQTGFDTAGSLVVRTLPALSVATQSAGPAHVRPAIQLSGSLPFTFQVVGFLGFDEASS